MKRITKILVLALVVIMLFGAVSSFAAEPYDTYTFSIDGAPLASPPVYSAMEVFDNTDMKTTKLDKVTTNYIPQNK